MLLYVTTVTTLPTLLTPLLLPIQSSQAKLCEQSTQPLSVVTRPQLGAQFLTYHMATVLQLRSNNGEAILELTENDVTAGKEQQ